MKHSKLTPILRPATTVLLGLALLCGCSDGNDTRRVEAPISLFNLLPDSTVGAVQWINSPSTPPNDHVSNLDNPWRHGTAQLIARFLIEDGMIADTQQAILLQTASEPPRFAIVAQAASEAISALFGLERIRPNGQYRGYPLHIDADSGTFISQLNTTTLVSGDEAAVESVIDTLLSTEAPTTGNLVKQRLDTLAQDRQWRFAYELPGMQSNVPTPGSGAYSLNRVSMIAGAFDITGGVLDGHATVVTSNAQDYTRRLSELLTANGADIFTASEGEIRIELAGLAATDDVRSLIQSLYFGMNTVDYAQAVGNNGNAPWLNFDVGIDPNSVFINFEFRDAQSRADFAAEHLPAGFKLAPLRILQSEEPRYFLVLNLYQSSGGLVEGARAEWSVFVEDPELGIPRFLVIQAAAENFTADSVNLLVAPEPVDHRLEDEAIVSYVGEENPETAEETLYFRSRINWPQPAENAVLLDREFVVANDYIFWGNGVADRGLYNSSVHNRPVMRIDNDQINIEDHSRWRDFVKAQPVHSLVYLNPLDIVISPWWNLDKPFLDISEAYREQLISFKDGFYPDLVMANAEGALNGTKLALFPTVIGETTPSTYYHFTINDPQGLFTHLQLADTFIPAPIALHENDAMRHYLTLSVYAQAGDPCGLRADWSTYVFHQAENEQDQVRTLRLDSLHEESCVDPETLLALPAIVQQSLQDERLQTRVSSPALTLYASLQLDFASTILPGQNWIAAGDVSCATNNVCDASYYDGGTLMQPLLLIDFEGVSIDTLSTPWNAFIDTDSATATVRRNPARQAINPWYNVPPFADLDQGFTPASR